jgi:hypothetical protein
MPRTVILDEEFRKIIKKDIKSNETTGTEYKFIVNKEGIREADDNRISKKGIVIREENYTITIEIKNSSNEIVELDLTTFKDFIIIDFDSDEDITEYIPKGKIVKIQLIIFDFTTDEEDAVDMIEGEINVIPLKKLSNKEEFKFSIKGHQIKMTIEKSIYKRLGKALINQSNKNDY